MARQPNYDFERGGRQRLKPATAIDEAAIDQTSDES